MSFLRLTIVTAAKALWLTMRAISYLLGGLLFGVLPLLVVIVWKCLRGGTVATWKVTTWIVGAALAIIVLMLKSA